MRSLREKLCGLCVKKSFNRKDCKEKARKARKVFLRLIRRDNRVVMRFMYRSFKGFPAASLVCALLVLTLGSHAQDKNQKHEDENQKTVKPTSTPRSDGKPLPVRLNVLAIDPETRPVTDVRREEFQVFEDDVPQTITSFAEKSGALSYGLVVDNSGSLASQLKEVIQAGKIIVAHNQPEDETFLVSFTSSDKIDTLADWTSDKKDLSKLLDDFYINSGQSAVIDAVYLSAQHVLEHQKKTQGARRYALVLVTDGEDRDSYYKIKDLIALLRDTNLQIFCIGLVGKVEENARERYRDGKAEFRKAVNLLNLLANETGGRAFFPASAKELPQIASTIRLELRAQYLIGYDSTNSKRDGSERKVRVTIKDSPNRSPRTALTRPFYTAPVK